jgi:hypothetical protein
VGASPTQGRRDAARTAGSTPTIRSRDRSRGRLLGVAGDGVVGRGRPDYAGRPTPPRGGTRRGGPWKSCCFAEYLASGPTIVDVGRWRSDSAASELVSAAASTVLVIHPTVAGVAHARSQYEDLAGRCSDVVVACRGDRPYDATEVAEAIGCGTATVIPVDRVGASMLSGAPKERWLRRTPLARSARGLVDSLTQHSAVAS